MPQQTSTAQRQGQVRAELRGSLFAQVPHRLLQDPDHKPHHVALYAAIHSMVDWATCNGWADRQELLRRAGFTKDEQLYNARWWLHEHGYLRWETGRGLRATTYYLHPEGDALSTISPESGDNVDAVTPDSGDTVTPESGATVTPDSGDPTRTLNETPGRDTPSATPGGVAAPTLVDLPGGTPEAPPDPDRGFDEFWDVYPKRNGKKRYKNETRRFWRKLTLEQRRRAYIGARNLAASGQIPQDPHRFLKQTPGGDWPFEDWQTPATPDHQQPSAREVGYTSQSWGEPDAYGVRKGPT